MLTVAVGPIVRYPDLVCGSQKLTCSFDISDAVLKLMCLKNNRGGHAKIHQKGCRKKEIN